MFNKIKDILIITMIMGTLFAAKFPADEYQRITVLFTNDVHGGIPRTEATFMNPQFPPKIGSAPAIAHYTKLLRAQAEAEGFGVLLIDEGDFFSGTPVGSKTAGAAVIEFMNAVEYDLLTAGNHDFDKSYTELEKRAKEANFPFLGANIVDETGNVANFLKPYIIKDIYGIKVGILGIGTAVTPSMSFPANVEGLTFLPEIATAKKWIPIMKEEGADVIILSTHSWTPYERDKEAALLHEAIQRGEWPDENKIGAPGMEIAVSVPGIDVMFTGHVHKGFPKPYEDPINHTLIFQNYGNGTNIGQVNFYIHKKTKTLAGYDFAVDQSAIITLLEDEFWIDTEIDSMIEARKAIAEVGFDKVITILPAPLRRANEGQSVLGNLLCDAVAWSSNADVAFSNYGGLRSDLEAGPLTYESLFRFLPFGNRITIFQMSGAELDALIEDRVSGNSRGMLVSGLEVIIDKRKAERDRAEILTVQGKTFDKKAIYKIAVSDYLAEGNSGYDRLTTIGEKHRNNTGLMMREALRDYIVEFGPNAKIDTRWKLIK
ncbi:MAG: bifunctional UDP-sugar hydrolase/5'-nucleotidase [Candidatus Marinimicrobia bacterium]|nr:bifunctional UDP-sugar hydrolase/5'-nucleotidase [Candidatus Neomarinimicrobiota bacterium]